MNFYKNIILFITLLSPPVLAQSFITPTNDTTKYIEKANKINNIKLYNSSIYQNNFLLQKQFNMKTFNYKLNQSNLIYIYNYGLNRLYDNSYLYQNSQLFSQRDFQIMQSKKELYRILAIKYKERNKYDLGEFGTYLGLSKDVTAIILAIITVVK